MKRFLLLLCIAMTVQGLAQVRPDIYSFTSAERTMLVNAMMEYITPEVVQKHCNHQTITGGGIHSPFDFLPFHRTYLEKMEDYLLSKGSAYHIFVPLPKWDPCTWTPPEFQVIDPDCATFTCDMDTPAICTNIPNWNPISVNSDVVLPYYLSLPIQPGNFNDLCDWDMYPVHPTDPTSWPSCCNSLVGAIATGAPALLIPPIIPQFWHSATHFNMGGVMGGMRSPIVPIFWLFHAYVDDVWKTWECNCSKSGMDNRVDLYMKDTYDEVRSERDRGEEPNIDNGAMWESEDIWVRNHNDGFIYRQHQNPVYSPGKSYYVYVQVRNRGCIPNTGSEGIELRWAKGGTQLIWPNYWNGSISSPILMGNLITTKPIPVIQPGSSTIIEFVWYPPNSANYAAVISHPVFLEKNPYHFRLLREYYLHKRV